MFLTSDVFQQVREIKGAELTALRETFLNAWPYPHVCIDNFLNKDFAEALVEDFPCESDPEYKQFCMEDDGRMGTNYANSKPETFAKSFKLLDNLCANPQFLNYITALTGIAHFEYDPGYHGGGIRESSTGMSLPVHIDFNYHPQTLTHRRLNLLLYLNKDWQDDWGGKIQVHLDPKVHKENSLISSYAPTFNRCFLFETSEVSWHGFSKLNLPDGIKRRAWTIYFYTQDRPNSANIKFRNTEYIEPTLPAHIQTGYTLTAGDIQSLKELLQRRDDRIEMLYRIRATIDDKYAHLWHEYEYYLEKYKVLEKAISKSGISSS